jgi:hypothetical protein
MRSIPARKVAPSTISDGAIENRECWQQSWFVRAYVPQATHPPSPTEEDMPGLLNVLL